jgi:hypothetical protein
MQPEAIFAPVIALAGLTFAVLFYTGYKRFGAGFAGRVTGHDFRVGESPNVPADVAVANRNLMNLLELPVLFYVICIAAYVTRHVDTGMVSLAWAFVAARLAHTLIHLNYNRILYRFGAYVTGCLILLAMWGWFAVEVMGRAA